MDPLTQGLLGAALPQSASNKRHIVAAGVLGVAAGMAPDLDVLIRSSSDPLLFFGISPTLYPFIVVYPFWQFSLCFSVVSVVCKKTRAKLSTELVLLCPWL